MSVQPIGTEPGVGRLTQHPGAAGRLGELPFESRSDSPLPERQHSSLPADADQERCWL